MTNSQFSKFPTRSQWRAQMAAALRENRTEDAIRLSQVNQEMKKAGLRVCQKCGGPRSMSSKTPGMCWVCRVMTRKNLKPQLLQAA